MDGAHVIQTTTVKERASLRYHMVNVAGTKAMLAAKIFILAHVLLTKKIQTNAFTICPLPQL